MRRRLLLLIWFLPLLASGQTFVGLRAGSGASGVSFNPSRDERMLYGTLDAGLLFRHYKLEYIGFQGEVNLTQRGYRVPLSDFVQYKRKNSYLEIPIFLQGRFHGKKLLAQLQAGCYGAFLLGSSEGYNESGSYQMTDYSFNILRDNRFDYGLVGSAGAGINLSYFLLLAEYRFYYGLGDLYRHTYTNNPRQSQQLSQVFGLNVSVNLDMLKKRRQEKINPFAE